MKLPQNTVVAQQPRNLTGGAFVLPSCLMQAAPAPQTAGIEAVHRGRIVGVRQKKGAAECLLSQGAPVLCPLFSPRTWARAMRSNCHSARIKPARRFTSA